MRFWFVGFLGLMFVGVAMAGHHGGFEEESDPTERSSQLLDNKPLRERSNLRSEHLDGHVRKSAFLVKYERRLEELEKIHGKKSPMFLSDEEDDDGGLSLLDVLEAEKDRLDDKMLRLLRTVKKDRPAPPLEESEDGKSSGPKKP
ncbi:hypothetical protein M3Y98_00705200 [Aphelenchoides besseyi]|nr:hypothetical protein M3Y98_00705200 [Aphelenchoides besseyi]KAI6210387.1 hypothetical protein M3Y96_00322800 [Aphelenchoides besseyi]